MKSIKTNFFIYIAVTACIMLYLACNESGNKTDSSTTNNTTINGDTTKSNNKIAEIVDAAGGLIKDVVETKKYNDSIRNANKENMWVYQIGSKMNDADVASKMYEQLKEIKNIFIFKKSKKEFYLIKDDAYSSKEQLTDSIGSVKKNLLQYSAERVTIVDLAQECSSKKLPTASSPIKYKVDGDKKDAPCRVCD